MPCVSLLLSHGKHVLNLLDKTSICDAKSAITPMYSNTKLSTYKGELYSNLALYQSIKANLQYTTLTHPYILFVINKVYQYMITKEFLVT